MKHSIKITQMLVTEIEIEASNRDEAIKIGNMILEKERIPLEKYEMIEATIEVDEKSNECDFNILELPLVTAIQ